MGIGKYKKNIGKYIACNGGASIFRIEDCYISSVDKCAYYLLWCIRKADIMRIMCLQVEDKPTNNKFRFNFISAEEASELPPTKAGGFH